MALYRRTQNDDMLQGQFWELPDHYWIGTMLINKHTLLPVGGYDTPLVNAGRIFQTGVYDNNGQRYKRYAVGNLLGQCGRMCIGTYTIRYISPTNILEDIPKAYVHDPSDPNIIYLQYSGDNVGMASFLVKYNVADHKMIWCRILYNPANDKYSQGFNKMHIFAIQNGQLYILTLGAQTPTPVSGSFNSDMSSYYGIICVSTETGYITKEQVYTNLPGTPDPVTHRNPWSYYGMQDCQYIGMVDQDTDLFLMTLFNTETPGGLGNNDRTGNMNFSTRTGYFKYSRINHTIESVQGNPLIAPRKTGLGGGGAYYVNSYITDGYSLLFPIASTPDKDITDSITCYTLHNPNVMLAINNPADQDTQLYKCVYKNTNDTQSFEPMTVLNADGNIMTNADWYTLSPAPQVARFCKVYILKGSSEKFLIACAAAGFDTGGPMDRPASDEQRATNDTYGFIAVFKFINPDTVQLVDKVNAAFTDLMWMADNVVVAARAKRIRIYSINKTTGEIELLKNYVPTSNISNFSYTCVDDIANLWFMETGVDPNNPKMRQSSLYFVNSFTVSKLVLIPEKTLYKFSGTEVETYVDIQAIGDLGDTIERDVKLTAVGPIKFKSSNSKLLQTKTEVGSMVRIPFIITGVGDATITITLVN